MSLTVPPPIIGIFYGFLIWLGARWFPELSVTFPGQSAFAGILGLIGATMDATSVLAFIKARTTISPLSPSNTKKFVRTGFYRISRNPMYLGMALLLSAYGVWLGSFILVPVLCLFVWYLTTFQIKPEEIELRRKFGEGYDQYCSAVRRWI
ncbi:protein-S-isoprenylcysteine O-methyltransferase Ste14 [Roseibium hamelinense]|uniref:Protein-S-isoprenylcysteine O-methyltransferase Ste14 n=1 Tax=Roseibium hamelinense TaxID=150831 RepID=A0A562T1Y6_9HYPH|nr:isoprenylcysteine carboxylmethyltransferase family protein [Roseibium hamelinense]MTI44703.1 isoprenylcysteine carboxylmethyltransferase family protein [Roseibium hamelinense]TWI87333.1 protein-S-isoprenylcysteine O-methyltransferase Ste14 [Roseibium hamelinense]